MEFVSDIVRMCATAGDAVGGTGFALFFGGIMAALFHCSFMCGPLLLSATGNRENSFTNQLAYHAGKLATYLILAVVFAVFADTVMAYLPDRVLLIAPVMVLAAALVLTSLIPQIGRLLPVQSVLARSGAVPLADKLMGTAHRFEGPTRSGMIGLASGLMPCGLTLGLLLASALSADPLIAMKTMALFGLGTSLGLTVVRKGFLQLSNRYPTLNPQNPGFQMISALWLISIAGFSLAS